MLEVIRNPKTESYQQLKLFTLSSEFTWFWFNQSTPDYKEEGGHVDVPFYAHTVLERPELNDFNIPVVKSAICENVILVLKEILDYNLIEYNCFLRSGFNCVQPLDAVYKTIPHLDHSKIKHKNILIYLNESDGDTIVGQKASSPKEDKVILFSGSHYHITPSKNRRIVLVATFI